MRCPECGEPLQRVRAHGIDLDRCLACDGVWFDRGELEAYRRARQDAGRRFEQPAALTAGAGPPRPRCPRCPHASLLASEAAGHELLRCEACAGCFLRRLGSPGPIPRQERAGLAPPDLWLTGEILDLICAIALVDSP